MNLWELKMESENIKSDKLLAFLLTILLILDITGLALCIKAIPRETEVYADDLEVIEEPIPIMGHKDCYIGTLDEPVEDIVFEYPYVIEVTDDDIDLLARVVMSEGSTISLDEKILIACTVVNRVKADTGEFGNQNTIPDVVYHGKAYSTADNGEPNEECYIAAMHALTHEHIIPEDVYWFCHNVDSSYGYWFVTVGATHLSSATNHNN